MADDISDRLSRLETTATSHDKRLTAHGKEIDELRKDQSGLDKRLTVIETQLQNILEGINKLNISVEELKNRPMQRGERIMQTIINTILIAALGVLIAKLGWSVS